MMSQFSVGLTVDELYNFSLDEDHQLRFRGRVDSDRLEAECMISKDQVAAGHGRARRSLDKTTPSYSARSGTSFVQKFRFPIIARGEELTASDVMAYFHHHRCRRQTLPFLHSCNFRTLCQTLTLQTGPLEEGNPRRQDNLAIRDPAEKEKKWGGH
ncbi:hypothetical protein PG987_016517 [Apiospora arundinis]